MSRLTVGLVMSEDRDGVQNIPLSSIQNLDALQTITEDEARAHLDAALDTMTFEQRAQVLRYMNGT